MRRRLKLSLLSIGLVASLDGCGVDDWVNQMNATRFRKTCDSLGIAQGTPAYSNCMVQQSAQNDEANQRIQDRAALDRAAQSVKSK